MAVVGVIWGWVCRWDQSYTCRSREGTNVIVESLIFFHNNDNMLDMTLHGNNAPFMNDVELGVVMFPVVSGRRKVLRST